jgi:LysM repeat protein
VKEGDTIFTIAQEYTVEPQAVMDVNPQIINQDLIFPGDSINIPPCSVVPQRVQLSAACAVNYIIQVGDTLFKLASQFKVPMGSLAAANNITNINFIRAGDVLQVPAACNSTGNSTSSSTPGLPGGRGLAMPNATGPGSMSPL